MSQRTVPTDVKLLNKQLYINQFKDVKANLGTRTGPYIIYLNESEDDTRIREYTRNFLDGIPTFNQTLADCTSGLIIIAGRANAGKSSVIINILRGALSNNEDVIVFDISLDDPAKKRYQQYITSLANLRYSEVSNPAILSNAKKAVYEEADEMFFKWIDEERLHSPQSIMRLEDGRSLRIRDYKTIVHLAKHARQLYPKSKIIFSIDAWNNMDYTSAGSGTEIQLNNIMLQDIKEAVEDNEIICFISAHIRKTNDKKYSIQDIKGTSDLEYHATVAFMLRNELKENALLEPLTYEYQGFEHGVFAIEVPKNKASEFTGNLYWPCDAARNTLIFPSVAEYKAMHQHYLGKRR